MWVSLTAKSGNRKVGAIPVSTTETASCPSSCPMKDTDCYARFGPLGMHWRKVGDGGRGDNWSAFCRRVASFLVGQLWRHNQAGDLPKDASLSDSTDRLDAAKCRELSEASEHTKGWTYTHYDVSDSHNRDVVKRMNSMPGLTVNLSADSLEQAAELFALGIGPVCVTIPENSPVRGNRANGVPIVVCPAQTQDSISCEQCGLCQVKERKSIVGFMAHGTAGKRLSKKLAAA